MGKSIHQLIHFTVTTVAAGSPAQPTLTRGSERRPAAAALTCRAAAAPLRPVCCAARHTQLLLITPQILSLSVSAAASPLHYTPLQAALGQNSGAMGKTTGTPRIGRIGMPCYFKPACPASMLVQCTF